MSHTPLKFWVRELLSRGRESRRVVNRDYKMEHTSKPHALTGSSQDEMVKWEKIWCLVQRTGAEARSLQVTPQALRSHAD